MSNSSLVAYTKISPNKTSPRNHEIDTVTIHCVVGQVTAESLGDWFAKSSTQASSNYGVDKNGRIGMYVEEKDRSWCTSNKANDNRAITIEVASDTKHPYAVTDAAYEGLIRLLVDICRRNPGIKRLRWKGDKSLIGQVAKQNMTVHKWFKNKDCPGHFLYSHHDDIVAKVNALLDSAEEEKQETTQPQAKEYFRVRKSWTDSKSQLGAYTVLENAKKKVDENPGYFVFNEQGVAVYPTSSSKKKVAFAKSQDKSLSGNYRVTANDGLNMRYVPGEIKKDNIILTIPKGAVVQNYGYFTKVNGVNWLYVAYKDKVGFISSAYVKKVN